MSDLIQITQCRHGVDLTVRDCNLCKNNAERIEELEEAVAQQAEDDGLWFIAETAPEAYLQNALRYLHALIEQDARALAALKGAR